MTGGKYLGLEVDEDSLLANMELAVGAVLSIQRDFDIKKTASMSVEESLASAPQGTAVVSLNALLRLFHSLSLFQIIYSSSFGFADSYPYEKPGEKGSFFRGFC